MLIQALTISKCIKLSKKIPDSSPVKVYIVTPYGRPCLDAGGEEMSNIRGRMRTCWPWIKRLKEGARNPPQ